MLRACDAEAMLADALLDFLPQQRADTLILEPGKPPVLLCAGERKPLSMPGLDAQMLDELVTEVTDAAARAQLDATQQLETIHRTRDGVEYSVSIRRSEEGVRLVFRSAKGKKAAPAPDPRPVVPGPVVAGPSPAIEPTATPGPIVVVDGAPVLQVAAPPRLRDEVPSTITNPALNDLLERAMLQGATDMFISPGFGVRLRVGDQLLELSNTGVDAEHFAHEFGPMWPRLEAELARSGSVDFAVTAGYGPHAARFRINLFRQLGGLAAAVRPIRREPPTLHGLGLGEELHALTNFRTGLVLMTGQAGSGKSTTLVALLERLNRSSARHIITIEDPIEYVYPRGRALIHQRELGVHVDSFGAGLRAALRESPDIILVGEMRDRETISAALTAAETGHLVLSTLHCGDASSAVHRIVDGFPEHQQQQVREQLASSLRAVVTQMLLPAMRGPRVAAYELMLVNVPVATKIREHRGHQLRSEIQKGRNEGMIPLELTLAKLVREQRISQDTARSVASDPRLLDDYIRQR
jgi:twitching motility protein PilT